MNQNNLANSIVQINLPAKKLCHVTAGHIMTRKTTQRAKPKSS